MEVALLIVLIVFRFFTLLVLVGMTYNAEKDRKRDAEVVTAVKEILTLQVKLGEAQAKLGEDMLTSLKVINDNSINFVAALNSVNAVSVAIAKKMGITVWNDIHNN